MKKAEAILLAIACFFAGGFIGFVISPAKQGFGNHSGNTNNFYAYKKEEIEAIMDKLNDQEKAEKK